MNGYTMQMQSYVHYISSQQLRQSPVSGTVLCLQNKKPESMKLLQEHFLMTEMMVLFSATSQPQ